MSNNIFILAIFLYLPFLPRQDENNYNKIVKKAFNGDKSVFSTEFLADAFGYWKGHLKLKSNTQTSKIYNSKYNENEIIIFPISGLSEEDYGIIFTIKGKITDIRRLLFIDRTRFHEEELELIKFLENFFWIYDTGNKNLIEDFFFPEYVQITYRQNKHFDDVIKSLRKDYSTILPFGKISWEREENKFIIHIYPKSGLFPIEIVVDIRKYKTLIFSNNYYKYNELKDSLCTWKDYRVNNIEEVYENANSSHEAIDNVINRYFIKKGFQLTSIEQKGDVIEFQLTLPSYEKFIAFPLKYRLTVQPDSKNRYFIKPSIIFIFQSCKKIRDLYSSILLDKNRNQLENILRLIERNIYTYSTPQLHPRFQPISKSNIVTNNTILLHHTRIDTISKVSYNSLLDILRKITKNHRVYYFIEKPFEAHNKLIIRGHSIWKNNELSMHHYAIICESYLGKNDEYELENVEVDLYPYIRDDNIASLYSIYKLESQNLFETIF